MTPTDTLTTPNLLTITPCPSMVYFEAEDSSPIDLDRALAIQVHSGYDPAGYGDPIAFHMEAIKGGKSYAASWCCFSSAD